MKRTELGKVESSEYDTPDGAEGQAQFLKVELPTGEIRNVELYQQPGVASGATPGHTALLIPVSGGGYRIAIGAHNYGLSIEASAGHTKIYSTDSSGSSVKCLLHLKADGKIAIENDDRSLKEVLDDLVDEIKNLTTTGSPTTHTVNASSQAALDAIKTKIGEILTDGSI